MNTADLHEEDRRFYVETHDDGWSYVVDADTDHEIGPYLVIENAQAAAARLNERAAR